MIYRYDQKHQLIGGCHLDESIHTQPEGIKFIENGDLFISNEGGV